MKYVIGILFVLAISLVGINEAFADNHHNQLNYIVDYINMDYDSSTETFSIDYSFDTNKQCSVKLSTMPRTSSNHGYDFQTNWYPNYYTFMDGKKLHGEGRWYATLTEVIPCDGKLEIPKSNLTLDESLYMGTFFYLSENGANTYPGNEASTITSVAIHYFKYEPPYVFCGAWVDKDLVIEQDLEYSTCNKFDSSTPKVTTPIQEEKETPVLTPSTLQLIIQPSNMLPTLTINGYLHNNPQGLEYTINFAQLHKTDDGKGAVLTDIVRYSPTTVNHTATVTNIILETVGSYEIVSSNSIGDYSLDRSECKVNGVSGDITFMASNNDDIVCNFHYDYNNPVSQSSNQNGGNSDTKDLIPPTLGMNEDHERIVENGFTFNGITTNVEHEYTEFPLIKTKVGQTNTIDLLIYENYGAKNISLIHIGLGLENKHTPISEAEATLDYRFRDTNSIHKAFEVIDDQNLLQNANMTGITSQECNERDNRIDYDCMKISFEYQYREAPLYNIIAIQLGDEYGNEFTFYFNEGISVIGESLNEPLTITNGGIDYTQIDKVNNIWKSDGIEYERISDTLFQRITP